MSIAWATIETGIANLVKARLSLTDAAVIWANQNASEPTTAVHTWVSLKRGDLVPIGIDGVQVYPTPASPAGAELTLRSQGVRTMTLGIQAYSRAGSTGNASAYALLSQLATQLRLPSGEAALLALGLGLSNVGAVRSLDGLADQRIQGRALLELMLNLVDTAEETVTYIERVTGDIDFSPAPLDYPFDSAT